MVTRMLDRGGRRVREYHRRDTTRPGQQERRARRATGEAWCRGCRAWLAATAVDRRGLCAPHVREDYRRHYAGRGGVAIRGRVHARRRGVRPVPARMAWILREQFGGRCAYCPAPATTWDHITPVKAGGDSTLGNVVPACASCNASKGARDLFDWCAGRPVADALLDVLGLGGY